MAFILRCTDNILSTYGQKSRSVVPCTPQLIKGNNLVFTLLAFKLRCKSNIIST